MGIRVKEFSKEPDRWNQLVTQSSGGSIFHRHECLMASEQAHDATLHRIIGYKGEEPIGIFPFLEHNKGPFSLVYSPLPESGFPQTGPVFLNYDKLDRRKRDQLSKYFIQKIFSKINTEIRPYYIRIQTPSNFEDPRPFLWSNADVTPRYTYKVDISKSEEDLLKSFTSDLRGKITSDYESDITFENGGHEGIDFVMEQIRERYNAQDRSYNLNSTFVHELYDELSSNQMCIFLGKVDGINKSGMMILRDDSSQYFWHGGGKPDTDMPVNDLLPWQIIKDGKKRGLKWYDLVGANTSRLITYKSKFNPDLIEYYDIEWDTVWSKAYRKVFQ